MATETQTGMDRAEMKRLLLKSKQEPVNCALGVGDDKSVALLTLSRNRSSKSLQGDLQKDFPTAFNTRFGTAMVDTDDDPTLGKFMINKAVGSMARRLVKTLKGTGFRKVQILLEDGSPVETAAEEEASEQAGIGAPGADSATGAPRPSPQAAPQPDAAALAAALAILVPRIAQVADPTQKEALAKQARVANVNIKTGNLTYAAGGIEQLRRALDASAAPAGSDSGVGQSAPSAPPPPPTSEAPPDAAALAAALALLIPRVAQVADPAQKEALAKQAREANVNIKTGNLVYAATGVEQLRRALDALVAPVPASESVAEQSAQSAAPPAPPPTPEAKPDPAALAAALTTLILRIGEVADPARKEALAKQAREANVNIKTGNLTYAATGIDQLRRALDDASASTSAADGPTVDAAAVRSVLAQFEVAQATVDGQIAQLQSKLRGSEDPDLQRIGEFGLNALTGNTRAKLQAAIMELRGSLPAIDPKIAANAGRMAEQMATYLAEDAKIRACDANPFDVSVSIAATLGGAARQLHEVLRKAA
jgi:hypothetical protein